MERNFIRVQLFFSAVIAAAFLCLSGCERSTSPSQPPRQPQSPRQEQVTIGCTLPLSGELASYGERSRKGMELALKDLAGKGEAPIKIVFEDDQGKTPLAVSAMTKLIDINKAPAILGSASSGVTMAMTGVANKRKVVVLSPLASSPELTTKGGPFFFRMAPSDTAQAAIMVEWMKKEGHTKIAILYIATTWGQSLFEAVKSGWEANGGQVTVSDSVQEGDSDFRTQIEKFKQSGATAFYVATHGREGGAFVKQARQLGVEVPFYGADVWSSPEFVEVGGAAVEGCKLIAPAKLSGPRYDAFAARYRKEYNEDPEVYAGYSYDAVMILAGAVSSGATTGEGIRNYLSKMVPFEGVSGTVSFDAHGDVIGQGFDRYIIKDGKPALIAK